MGSGNFADRRIMKRILLLVLFTATTSLWAGTALVGWSVTYPTVDGNTYKSQLKNTLLEGVLADLFERGWIAFDLPHSVELASGAVLPAFQEEALRNGAGLGLYFHVTWKSGRDEETQTDFWTTEGVNWTAVSFIQKKVLGSGKILIKDFILPSKDEKKLNEQASSELLKAFAKYF